MNQPSIYSLIERHYEQIELFYYQNQREISRPKTKLINVIAWATGFFSLIIICVALNILIEQPLYIEIPISILVYVLITETFLRILCIKIIECYQHYAKESTRRKCLCVPSCSEYSIICLKKMELIYALIKIYKRLFITCKGIDYIIDNP